MNKPRLALERPTNRHEAAARVAAKLEGEGVVRLVVELSPDLHYALKVRALQKKLTLKGYLLALAEADGVKLPR